MPKKIVFKITEFHPNQKWGGSYFSLIKNEVFLISAKTYPYFSLSYTYMHIQGSWGLALTGAAPLPLESLKEKNKLLFPVIKSCSTIIKNFSSKSKETGSIKIRTSAPVNQLPMPQPLLAQSVQVEMATAVVTNCNSIYFFWGYFWVSKK